MVDISAKPTAIGTVAKQNYTSDLPLNFSIAEQYNDKHNSC